MKALAALFVLLPMASHAAQVCVERLEDDGYPNIHPVTLMQGKRDVATLIGGDRKCVTMNGPVNTFWLRWHAFDWNRPDHGLHNKRVLHSTHVLVVPVKGERHSDLKVCSKRSQGEPPVWHISGDGLGDCRDGP
jgi:hypothetical protein